MSQSIITISLIMCFLSIILTFIVIRLDSILEELMVLVHVRQQAFFMQLEILFMASINSYIQVGI